MKKTRSQRLRRLNLLQTKIWGPDVRTSTFEVAAHEQSLAVARSSRAQEDQAFIARTPTKSMPLPSPWLKRENISLM